MTPGRRRFTIQRSSIFRGFKEEGEGGDGDDRKAGRGRAGPDKRSFDGCGLPLHGACAFAELSHNLLPCRAAARLPDKPGTVLTLLFPYRFPDRGPRNLSRYAACLPDYHLAAGEVLSSAAAALRAAYPRYRFEPFVDNSPLPEVRAAALSGLGCIGDNGLLIHPVYGSWVFIAAIVTDMVLPLPPAGPPPAASTAAPARPPVPRAVSAGKRLDGGTAFPLYPRKKEA